MLSHPFYAMVHSRFFRRKVLSRAILSDISCSVIAFTGSWSQWNQCWTAAIWITSPWAAQLKWLLVSCGEVEIVDIGGKLGLKMWIRYTWRFLRRWFLPVIFLFWASWRCFAVGYSSLPGLILDADWSKCCADLSRAVEWLNSIRSQNAWSSWCHFTEHKKCPCYRHRPLRIFDDLLKSAVKQNSNSNLSNSQWIKANLPIKGGGLGIRCLSLCSHFLPSWLQRQAFSHYLQSLTLEDCYVSEDTHMRQ